MIKLVAFDMDGVLTKHPSSWHFVHQKLGVDNLDNLTRYRSGAIKYSEFLDSDISLWIDRYPGIRKEQITEILEQIPVRDSLKETIETIKEHGAKAVIISGGISWLADILNEIVEFDNSFANVVNSDEKGIITRRGTVVVDPRNKDAVLMEIQRKYGITEAQTASIGDSLYDSGLFRYSAKGIAFNSNSQDLDKIADFSVTSGNLMDICDIIFD